MSRDEISREAGSRDHTSEDRASQDQRALSDALRQLGSLMEREADEAEGVAAESCATVSAARLVADAMGIDLSRLPAATSEVDLGELCEANHVRCRRVALVDDWWRQDAGPLVARFRADGEKENSETAGGASAGGASAGIVALLPDGPGRYRLVDPARKHEAAPRVDAELASRLEDHGWVLYRPLPDRPLTWVDLVRAGWRGRGRDFGLLALAGLVSGVLALAVPVVTGALVDQAIIPSDRAMLGQMVAALVVAAAAAVLFQVVHGLTLLRLTSRIDGDLQAALWDRLLSLPVSFYRRFTVGDMGARAMGLERIRNLLTGDVTSAVLSAVAALASWGILFYYSPPMALLATGLAVILVLVTVTVSTLQLRHQRRVQHIRGKLASLMYALLGGIEKLRIGQAESRAFSTWAHRFAEQRRHSVAAQRLANGQAVFTTIYGVVGTLAIFFMVLKTRGAGMSVGEFLAFHAAFGQFQSAIFGVVAIVPTVLDFVPTYERIRPILDTVPEVEAGRRDPGTLRGALELRNVSFRYTEDGPWVLDGVSLRIEPGEMVALVGPSGSGKSSSLRLLLGFEKPQDGNVLVDGVDLASLDQHLVRRQLGVVLQDHQPMAGDIFRNIVGGRPLSMEQAWDAARKVGLDQEIDQLPMGMFTFVNQRGVTLSGGQRQRLLLARAIVHKPRALLLDEATSALDNRTQKLVIESLESLSVTRLVIAHRLSTIRHADRIYVLEKGRVVEEGRFEELMAAEGLFARMAARQQV